MKNKKTVFFTGASGNMGTETLKRFIERNDRFNVKILVLPTKYDKKAMRQFRKEPSIEIIWGDMTNRELIYECVKGSDFVLHIGAMVSPMADKFPEKTMITNYGSTLAIIDAIKKQPNSDDIGLVYIGTVAETGCRMPPIHWGRCGDPIKGSVHDYYASSKIASERAVFESGLKKWVSLRQTGLLPVKRSASDEPIIFHQNLNNVLEWVTASDSGTLMANVCEEWIPDSFWRKCYNIGGGKGWRFTHWEFLEKNMEPLGISYRDVFDTRDLALYNFHGQWFTDSDTLDDITHFRSSIPEQFFAEYTKEMSKLRLNPITRLFIPTAKKLASKIKKIAKTRMGTGWMFSENKENWILPFFGSRKKQSIIKSWADGYELIIPSCEPTYLDHGYDESKPTSMLDINDLKKAAKFRGGECLSANMVAGDIFNKLRFKCAFNHEFDATPNLILKAGHWCPYCERGYWNYGEIAKKNPFFAQVWTPIHGKEDNVKVKRIVDDSIVSI